MPFVHEALIAGAGIAGLSAGITLVLEDSETRLQPGEIVIQPGTNHA